MKATRRKRTKTKNKGKGKGKHNAKAEYFAGYSPMQRLGTHEEGLLVERSAKDTTSLETQITLVENTKTEPPITGMLIQSDEGGEIPADPAQWMYSVRNKNLFLSPTIS